MRRGGKRGFFIRTVGDRRFRNFVKKKSGKLHSGARAQPVLIFRLPPLGVGQRSRTGALTASPNSRRGYLAG